jgi:hypothetical protein
MALANLTPPWSSQGLWTLRGRPFVEMVAAQPTTDMDFDRAADVRRELGLNGLTVTRPTDFDDPAFSRPVLGLEP